jgi:hypothetical protein
MRLLLLSLPPQLSLPSQQLRGFCSDESKTRCGGHTKVPILIAGNFFMRFHRVFQRTPIRKVLFRRQLRQVH